MRNAFTPVGTADLALMGDLVRIGCHMGTPRDLLDVLAMLPEHPARILGLGGAALTPRRARGPA